MDNRGANSGHGCFQQQEPYVHEFPLPKKIKAKGHVSLFWG